MAKPVGNYDIVRALNTSSPVARRIQLGTLLNNLVNAVNAMAAQNDAGLAFDAQAASLTYSSGGTYTIGGSIANGNWFTVTLVNPNIPSLVTPGLTVGPVQIVTADTTTTVATKLAAALNASVTLMAAGIACASAAAVVTIKVPGAVGTTTLTSTLSSGAAITVTAVNTTQGAGTIPSRLVAAFAIQPLNQIP